MQDMALFSQHLVDKSSDPKAVTSEAEYVLHELQSNFKSGRTCKISWRYGQLEALLAMIEENEQEICRVLRRDLSKPMFESRV